MDVTVWIWWWMIPIAIVVAILAIVIGLVWRRRRARTALPVAHVERLTRIPQYRRAMYRHRGVALVAVLAVAIAALGAGILSARPAAVESQNNDEYKRDILLCLDVSGSMVSVDAEILRVFQEIATSLNGERIGLRIFDSSSVMVFPLTSDYDYIIEQLELYERAFDGGLGSEEYFSYTAGTTLGNGASLVGDGLASCAMDFESTDDSNRPRSIILATDNMVNGQQLVSLMQAGQMALDNDVRVYAINPWDFGSGDLAAAELQEVAEGTGGAYFALDWASTVDGIVDRINAIEAGYIETPPEAQIVDRSMGWIPWVYAAVAVVVLAAWRLRI